MSLVPLRNVAGDFLGYDPDVVDAGVQLRIATSGIGVDPYLPDRGVGERDASHFVQFVVPLGDETDDLALFAPKHETACEDPGRFVRSLVTHPFVSRCSAGDREAAADLRQIGPSKGNAAGGAVRVDDDAGASAVALVGNRDPLPAETS